MSNLSVICTLILFLMMGFALPVHGQNSGQSKPDIINLRKSFAAAMADDFEIVKDIRFQRAAARGGETYWLVHVKPKRAGHFTLKYTFKYDPKLKYPEEGENELIIRVGRKNCSRYNYNNSGFGNVCLGDTVIVPIRLDRLANHEFSLKSDYEADIGREPVNTSVPGDLRQAVSLDNQLSGYIKYLGMQRYEMPHRSCCDVTVVYTAYFQASAPGRFNLELGSLVTGAELSQKPEPFAGLPVIIVKPGTPVTALVHHENTVSYADQKRFSAHAGNDFLTKLLILQPGDIFAVEYSSGVRRSGLRTASGDKMDKSKYSENDDATGSNLVIRKLPFAVDKGWSYNEWLIDYLPDQNPER